MPTSSTAGFLLRSGSGGGQEAPPVDSQLPWRAAVGNRVRLVWGERRVRGSISFGAVRIAEEVAIGRLALRPHYIRFLFAMSSIILRFIFARGFLAPSLPESHRSRKMGAILAVRLRTDRL